MNKADLLSEFQFSLEFSGCDHTNQQVCSTDHLFSLALGGFL